MNLTLRVWRQKKASEPGRLVDYPAQDISPDMSFLEMLDVVNEGLIQKGEEPIAFDSDCREGICGMCSLVINGVPHGGFDATATCQLHMRHFHDGQTITIEPWRAKAFPVVKDCVCDRSSFDRVIQAGGFVSVGTGGTPDANVIPISKKESDRAMDAAQCIGCEIGHRVARRQSDHERCIDRTGRVDPGDTTVIYATQGAKSTAGQDRI